MVFPEFKMASLYSVGGRCITLNRNSMVREEPSWKILCAYSDVFCCISWRARSMLFMIHLDRLCPEIVLLIKIMWNDQCFLFCFFKTLRLRHGCTWPLTALSSTYITVQICMHGCRICLAWSPLSLNLGEMGRREERREIKRLIGNVTSLSISLLPAEVMNVTDAFTGFAWWSDGWWSFLTHKICLLKLFGVLCWMSWSMCSVYGEKGLIFICFCSFFPVL